MKQTGIFLQLKVVTGDILSDLEVETLKQNVWALLNEVRPDLVEQGLFTYIKYIDVDEC